MLVNIPYILLLVLLGHIYMEETALSSMWNILSTQNRAISEQRSKFLCTTDGLWSYASQQTVSEQSSKF